MPWVERSGFLPGLVSLRIKKRQSCDELFKDVILSSCLRSTRQCRWKQIEACCLSAGSQVMADCHSPGLALKLSEMELGDWDEITQNPTEVQSAKPSLNYSPTQRKTWRPLIRWRRKLLIGQHCNKTSISLKITITLSNALQSRMWETDRIIMLYQYECMQAL